MAWGKLSWTTMSWETLASSRARGAAGLASAGLAAAGLALLLGAGAATAEIGPPPFDRIKAEEPKASAPDVTQQSRRIYMDDAAFRAAFEGRTIHLRLGDLYYGSEQFFEGDRSLWAFRDGECQQGVWTYTKDATFCFTYNEADGQHCWIMYQQGDTLYAEGDSGLTLEVSGIDEAPLACGNAPVS